MASRPYFGARNGHLRPGAPGVRRRFRRSGRAVRKALIETRILLTYERQSTNLGIQEARLRRQRDQDRAELKGLQAERQLALEKARKLRASKLDTAALQIYLHVAHGEKPFTVETFGFEFSPEKILQRAAEMNPRTCGHPVKEPSAIKPRQAA